MSYVITKLVADNGTVVPILHLPVKDNIFVSSTVPAPAQFANAFPSIAVV